MLFLEDKGDSA